MTTKTPTLREAAQALLDAWERGAPYVSRIADLRTALAVPAQGDDALDALLREAVQNHYGTSEWSDRVKAALASQENARG